MPTDMAATAQATARPGHCHGPGPAAELMPVPRPPQRAGCCWTSFHLCDTRGRILDQVLGVAALCDAVEATSR